MYLLIPIADLILLFFAIFTSHYVSINSISILLESVQEKNLHPTMYLLILCLLCHKVEHIHYLHPTMYLLILIKFVVMLMLIIHLHPTMYLLIPVIIKASLFLNSEALFCLPFKSANRLLILYALNMLEA